MALAALTGSLTSCAVALQEAAPSGLALATPEGCAAELTAAGGPYTLAAGASTTATLVFTVAGTGPAGATSLSTLATATADPAGALSEASETNNTASASVTVRFN